MTEFEEDFTTKLKRKNHKKKILTRILWPVSIVRDLIDWDFKYSKYAALGLLLATPLTLFQHNGLSHDKDILSHFETGTNVFVNDLDYTVPYAVDKICGFDLNCQPEGMLYNLLISFSALPYAAFNAVMPKGNYELKDSVIVTNFDSIKPDWVCRVVDFNDLNDFSNYERRYKNCDFNGLYMHRGSLFSFVLMKKMMENRSMNIYDEVLFRENE